MTEEQEYVFALITARLKSRYEKNCATFSCPYQAAAALECLDSDVEHAIKFAEHTGAPWWRFLPLRTELFLKGIGLT